MLSSVEKVVYPLYFQVMDLMDQGYVVRWGDRVEVRARAAANPEAGLATESPPPNPKDRIKFTCSDCGLNAWAKPTALLKCAPCDAPLLSDEAVIDDEAIHDGGDVS